MGHLDHVESNNSKPKQNMSNFTLRDTFNGRNISNHRTLRAALESERKFLKSVRKSNGSNSYIPTKILCNGEPLNEAMMNEAIEIGIQMMTTL
jgi:hypothetical protein